MPLLRRSDWSLVRADFSALPGALPEAAQHHAGGRQPTINTASDLVEALRNMERAQMDRGDGLIATAYHRIVVNDGPMAGWVAEGRPWGVQGGATLNHNGTSRAVMIWGDFTHVLPTGKALGAAASAWVSGIRGGYVSYNARFGGHRDFAATSCPGDALEARLPQLWQRVKELMAPKVDWQYLAKLAAWQKEVSQPGGQLRRGDRGPNVKILNDLLLSQGFIRGMGDAYGEATSAGVFAFKTFKEFTKPVTGDAFGGAAAKAILA